MSDKVASVLTRGCEMAQANAGPLNQSNSSGVADSSDRGAHANNPANSASGISVDAYINS